MKELKTLFTLACASAGLIAALSFQNCAPTSSSAFDLGSTGASGNSAQSIDTSTPMTAQPISMPSSSFQEGTALTAHAVLTGTNTTASCSWSVLNASSQIVANVMLTSSGGVCTLSGLNAPTTAAGYMLELSANNGTDPASTVSIPFMATAAPAPSPTPAPPSANCAGTYNMVADGYVFVLTIADNGGTISGTMLYFYEGQNYTYPINGTCSMNGAVGAINFIRTNSPDQNYSGSFALGTNNSEPTALSGTFYDVNSPTIYTWSATNTQ